MNKVILMGRLTRDPEIRVSVAANITTAKFTLAADRKYKKEGEQQTADFISCTAFGKTAESIERYLHQGTKIAVVGRIQTGSYTIRCTPQMSLLRNTSLRRVRTLTAAVQASRLRICLLQQWQVTAS